MLTNIVSYRALRLDYETTEDTDVKRQMATIIALLFYSFGWSGYCICSINLKEKKLTEMSIHNVKETLWHQTCWAQKKENMLDMHN